MPALTVIIINYNSWPLLETCLEKLKQQTFQDFNVIVIDNASTTVIPKNFFSRYANIQFIQNTINTGFSAANNQAINSLHGVEWCVLLNPDAFPEPDWLARLLAAAKQNPEYAIFASRQLMQQHSQLLDGDGDAYHISGLMWRRGYGKPVATASNANREVFSACAAAAMYKTKVLLAVAGFDEDFFCYAEDVDLGFRLRLAGFKCLLVADAVVHHVGSAATGGQHSDFSVYYGHRNLVWTFVKNMPGLLFWGFLPLHIMLNLLTLLVFTAKGQGAVIFRAKYAALTGLPNAWRKRTAIQKNRLAACSEIWWVLDKGFKK